MKELHCTSVSCKSLINLSLFIIPQGGVGFSRRGEDLCRQTFTTADLMVNWSECVTSSLNVCGEYSYNEAIAYLRYCGLITMTIFLLLLLHACDQTFFNSDDKWSCVWNLVLCSFGIFRQKFFHPNPELEERTQWWAKSPCFLKKFENRYRISAIKRYNFESCNINVPHPSQLINMVCSPAYDIRHIDGRRRAREARFTP